MLGLEELFSALLGAAPELGIVVLVVALLLIFIWVWFKDRAQHAEVVKGLTERFNAEAARVNTAHDEELQELRNDIKDLREQVDALNKSIDIERKARREAEDVAATAVRRANDAESRFLGPGSRPLGAPRHQAGGQQ